VGGTLFFTANEGAHGRELWKSDGTARGTVLVKDINPDTDPFGPSPNNLAAVGGTLFFAADDGVNGRELWKSNGTARGTVLVKDINPGSAYGSPLGSFPSYLTNVAGTLFFAAFDQTNGLELWKSNGTSAGTVLVADIVPGSGGSFPNHLTAVGATLFFTAFDPAHGIELWQSDGTAAGTTLVKDINPGSDFSSPSELAFVNGALFFAANDGQNGREPWILKVDPPAAGAARTHGALGQGSSPHTIADVRGPDRSRRAQAAAAVLAGDAVFRELGLDADSLAGLGDVRGRPSPKT
jgi:ELWxxDGT repeat protein